MAGQSRIRLNSVRAERSGFEPTSSSSLDGAADVRGVLETDISAAGANQVGFVGWNQNNTERPSP